MVATPVARTKTRTPQAQNRDSVKKAAPVPVKKPIVVSKKDSSSDSDSSSEDEAPVKKAAPVPVKKPIVVSKKDSSSDSDSCSDYEPPVKKAAPVPVKKPIVAAKKDSSSDSSSSSDNEKMSELPSKKQGFSDGSAPLKKPPAFATGLKRAFVSADSSYDEPPVKTLAIGPAAKWPPFSSAKHPQKKVVNASSGDSSSDGDENNVSSKYQPIAPSPLQKATLSFSSSVCPGKEKQSIVALDGNGFANVFNGVSKPSKPSKNPITTSTVKRKLSDNEEAVSGFVQRQDKKPKLDSSIHHPKRRQSMPANPVGAGANPTGAGDGVAPNSAPRPHQQQHRQPFRRVDDDAVQVRSELADNSFTAKVGARGSYGERADNTLKFTRGRDFRHEKTKKKRGTYTGGNISTNVCSFKFDD